MRSAVVVLGLSITSCTFTDIDYPEGPNGETQGFIWQHEKDTTGAGDLIPFDLDAPACLTARNLDEKPFVDAIFFERPWKSLFVEPELCEDDSKRLSACVASDEDCSGLTTSAIFRATARGWVERAVPTGKFGIATKTCGNFQEVGRQTFSDLLLADVSANGRNFLIGGQVDSSDVLYRWTLDEVAQIELPSPAPLRAVAIDQNDIVWIVDDALRRTEDSSHLRWRDAYSYVFPDETGDWRMEVALTSSTSVLVATPSWLFHLEVDEFGTDVHEIFDSSGRTTRLVRRGARIGRISSGAGEIFEPQSVDDCGPAGRTTRLLVEFSPPVDALAFRSANPGRGNIVGATENELLLPFTTPASSCGKFDATPVNGDELAIADIAGFRERVLVLKRSDMGSLTLAEFGHVGAIGSVHCDLDLGVGDCLGGRLLATEDRVFVMCTRAASIFVVALESD